MSERKNIIKKAAEKVKASFNDYEKSLTLIDKHNLPVVYGALGSDLVQGAASVHDKKINIKKAYTPKTITTRALQRLALGAATGAGLSYIARDNPDAPTVLKDAGVAATVGAVAGATVGPAMAYAAGRSIEKLRQKSISKIKQLY